MSVNVVESLSLSNLSRPEVRANPYPFYHQLRSVDPVHWDEEMGFWVLTRYDDIGAVLRDPRFSKARGLENALQRYPETGREKAEEVYGMFSKQMLFADRPYHTRLRGLVNKAFTPRVVREMRPRIQKIVDLLLDNVEERGRMDVIEDFAYPLPFTVILEMMGFPLEDRRQLKRWSDDFMEVLGVVRQDTNLMERAWRTLGEFTEYILDLQAQRDRRSQDTVLNALFDVEEQGDTLSQEEVVANAIVLLGAGHETTTNLIGNGLLALMRHPDQMRRLQDDPTLIESAVDELQRYDNPVQILWRMAAEDLEIDGRPIQEGQMVNLVIGAANRDPAKFPEPDRLDLTRDAHRHAGFGFGMHFCLGSALARLEGQIAIDTVVRRMPNLRLATDTLEWEENPIFHGLKALPVEF